MDRTKFLEGVVSDLVAQNQRNPQKRIVQNHTTNTTNVSNTIASPVFVSPVTVATGTPAASIPETELDFSDYIPANASAVIVSVRLIIPAATTETKMSWRKVSGGDSYRLLSTRVEADDGVAVQATMPVAFQKAYFLADNTVTAYSIELQGYYTPC